MTESKKGEPEKGDLTLEGRLRRLEEIVSQLEAEELELDRALALFEEGVVHVKEAEQALAAAELRVEELLGSVDEDAEGDGIQTKPLQEDGS
jgi:exodeoxyribonuclease VII small subunit